MPASEFFVWAERRIPEEHRSLLDGVARVIEHGSATADESLASLTTANGILAGGRLKYSAELIERNSRLKVICRTGIGYDNVDVEAATQHNVYVCNVPDGPTISTAEHAFAMLLAVAKSLKSNDQDLRNAVAIDYFSRCTNVELYRKCLGLIGFGRIGRRVARSAQALEMRVIVFDPWVSPEAAVDCGVEPVGTLEELLRAADAVSLHLPLTQSTRGLIGAAQLAMMKPRSILINTARGPLVDTDALANALQEGRLFGAGVDVFESEPPPPDHPLLQLDNVIVTLHVAGATQAGKSRLLEMAVRQLVQVATGQRPDNVVNPDADR